MIAANYYTNFTYLNQQGVVVNQFLRRFSLRFNTEYKPLKHVKIGENMLLTYRSNPFIYAKQRTARIKQRTVDLRWMKFVEPGLSYANDHPCARCKWVIGRAPKHRDSIVQQTR